MKNINFLKWDWDCVVKVTKDTMTSKIRQGLSFSYRIVGEVEFDADSEWEIGEGQDNEKRISRIIKKQSDDTVCLMCFTYKIDYFGFVFVGADFMAALVLAMHR